MKTNNDEKCKISFTENEIALICACIGMGWEDAFYDHPDDYGMSIEQVDALVERIKKWLV